MSKRLFQGLMTPDGHRRIVLRLLIAAISLVACVYLAEAFLRLVFVRSLLNRAIPPHVTQRHKTDDYDVEYRYNNLSLRGDDVDLSDSYDVCLIGDSFFFGLGVAESDTVCASLEGEGIRCINASEIATNPVQYYNKIKMLVAQGMRVKRVCVGLFTGNDFQNILSRDVAEFLDHSIGASPLDDGVWAFFLLERLRFALYRVECKIRNRLVFRTFAARKRYHPDWIAWYTEGSLERMQAMTHPAITAMSESRFLERAEMNTESIRATARVLNRMRDTIPALTSMQVVIIPDIHHVRGEESGEYRKLLRRFRSLLDGAIEVIDLHPHMDAQMYFPNDGHWNALGHKTAAEAIMQETRHAR